MLTPNIPEAEVLFGASIHSAEDMERAAQAISEEYHCAVLLKGGHQLNDANDLLYAEGKSRWFYGRRIDNPNTHGTGCTLSSAIASNLAKGYGLEEAVEHLRQCWIWEPAADRWIMDLISVENSPHRVICRDIVGVRST